MTHCRIERATITAYDLESLRCAWRQYGKDPGLVQTFRFEGRLTDSQLRRLPKGLREKLKTDDSVAWLERLYGLDSGETTLVTKERFSDQKANVADCPEGGHLPE